MKKLLSKILLSIIFILSSLIFVEYGENEKLFKDKVLNNNISFSELRSYYDKYFKGDKVSNEDNNDMLVNNVMEYEYIDGRYKYLDEDVNVIQSGIVVYVGEKDNLGNTVIVQGIDGIDVWYSNLTDVRVSLYDYVSKGDNIALSKEYYLVSLMKDGTLISYDEYN
jgi:hypothetical protein